jgi:hypothetical protein
LTPIRRTDAAQSRLLKFRKGSGKRRKAALQTNQQRWECPDAGVVQILASGEMYNHLT